MDTDKTPTTKTYCPNCGSGTYTYGDPLPWQRTPAPGELWARKHTACINCIWTSELTSELRKHPISIRLIAQNECRIVGNIVTRWPSPLPQWDILCG